MNIAYLRVSTDSQDTDNQKLAISGFCQVENIQIDKWIEISVSSGKSMRKRRVDELLETVRPGDRVIVSELSRLGRSVGQIAHIVDALVKSQVGLVCLKENIRLNGKMDMTAKVQVTMFSLFAEIERDLISKRTKEGLAKARELGHIGGRPKGQGKSRLDDHRTEIEELLKLGVPKTRIAEKFGVHEQTVHTWIRIRKISKSVD